jgi:hypothetical protein
VQCNVENLGAVQFDGRDKADRRKKGRFEQFVKRKGDLERSRRRQTVFKWPKRSSSSHVKMTTTTTPRIGKASSRRQSIKCNCIGSVFEPNRVERRHLVEYKLIHQREVRSIESSEKEKKDRN